ncbi:MAG: glycoside hydrolase family 105 protein [Eisenbergiella sp.]
MPQRETYIRPYRDGIFFGQWFYAVQVGLHGLMHAAKATGNREHLTYFVDSIQTMADYFEYKDWDKEQFGDPTLIPRAWGLPDLDACGTIGVSLIETYEITGNQRLLPVIHAIGDAVMNHIPRFPDGTYFRVKTMWADDLYMSCPFLARLFRLTGDKTYEEQVHLQVEGFRKRLWIEKEQIFSHIYFPEEEQMSGIPWGRGNGWIAVTLTEILTLLPKENPHWCEELRLYQRFMQGILACQDSSGMWHQVLNRPDTYQETSCTAMFLLSIARGINHGWLDAERYLPCIRKAWTAILQYSVDAVGDVYGVCLGSGCAKDAEYYKQLPTKKNDDHGTGIVMMAAAEMMKITIKKCSRTC